MTAHLSAAIETGRLFLELLQPSDAQDTFEYARDPDVSLNTTWEPHRTVADSERYVSFVISHDSAEPPRVRHVWGIRVLPSTQVVGTIDFVQDSAEEGHVDYALARPFWNRGCMTEAVRAVTAWAFAQVPQLQRIRSGCLERNASSARVLEKAGFELVERNPRPGGLKANQNGLAALSFILTRERVEMRAGGGSES
jgi:[ribosomal protein S5]-alanine N-acetyltransferase